MLKSCTRSKQGLAAYNQVLFEPQASLRRLTGSCTLIIPFTEKNFYPTQIPHTNYKTRKAMLYAALSGNIHLC